MNDPVTRTGMDRWPSDVGPRTGTATGKAGSGGVVPRTQGT